MMEVTRAQSVVTYPSEKQGYPRHVCANMTDVYAFFVFSYYAGTNIILLWPSYNKVYSEIIKTIKLTEGNGPAGDGPNVLGSLC